MIKSLKARNNDLSNPEAQIKILNNGIFLGRENYPIFQEK